MSVTSFIGNDVEYDFVVLGGSVASLSGNSLMQTVHTHCASVHQAAKLVAALLRVAGVTAAALAENNGSLPPGLWLTSPAGYFDQLRNPTLCNRVWATFNFYLLLFCA